VLNVDLWRCYVFYVRETKSQMPSFRYALDCETILTAIKAYEFREKMAQAYDFALEKVGLDIGAYPIYKEYVDFLKSVPAVGQYAENQRISAIRKVFKWIFTDGYSFNTL